MLILLASLGPASPRGIAQSDTVKLQWPNPPFASSHNINGTFCEYRNTLSANHFHNGVDDGEPDGNPIYPSIDGTVYDLSTTSGDNNYVRVKTSVGGVWKHISYVHIQPNPALSPGSPVTAGVTVLGNVLTGLGHVHITERELVTSENGNGVEINAIRAGGGLTPYVDTYTPVIDRASLQFRQHETGSVIPGSTLFGNVDIIIRVNERNGPGSPGSTQTNNGTYMIGYRLRSADTTTVEYEPPDNGLRFRFDRKPSDSYVDIAFLAAPYSTTSSHYYRLTSGNGASAVNSMLIVPSNSLNTESLPEESYVLEIFTEDTRGNADQALFPISVTRKDLLPPAPPVLKSVIAHSIGDTVGGVTVSWYPNTDPDLKGYRLYYTHSGDWKVAALESTLTKNVTSITLATPSEFLDTDEISNSLAFRLTAVDTVTPPNESTPSDVYAMSTLQWVIIDCGDGGCGPFPDSILIVDGFDRFGGSGSWSSPTHSFVQLVGNSLPELSVFSSCANDAIIDGSMQLDAFRTVIWILGDESTADETFSSIEQQKVKQFLEHGGKLFVSGSEIGWDLGRTHTLTQPGDLSFYNNYLKASFVYDGISSMTMAPGVAGQMFEGYTFTFGQTYPEDYPDDINPVNGSYAVLNYNATRSPGVPRIAGIAYEGTFGAGAAPGKLVYLAFPFETIVSQLQRTTLIDKAFGFFGLISDVPRGKHPVIPTAWALSQNYPNPFNPTTSLDVEVPARSYLTLKVYDMLGREIQTLLEGEQPAGTHPVTWDASDYPSGTYFVRLQAGSTFLTRKLLLVK